MILYNVTINIEKEVEEEWKAWMKEVHIPDVMATGMFQDKKFYKLLHETEDGGINYCVQYFAAKMEDVQQYHAQHAPRLQAEVQKHFKDRFVVFRSLLELVD
ncbi:DUF4286 family protein [Pararhodonellum marinum]|uniref:DUF4286 family protein n=1 Tax=Pararhodonellum marinum TaxID=2755358 RepID=UPI00188FF735|nr:DUF4286 family protein [Pararhodonellum marinum]